MNRDTNNAEKVFVSVYQSHEDMMVKVATVSVDRQENLKDTLEEAMSLTNSSGKENWHDNSGVKAVPSFSIPIRNTEAGDVMKIEGEEFTVTEFGFDRNTGDRMIFQKEEDVELEQESSKNISTSKDPAELAQTIREREKQVSEAISGDTRITNLAHQADPIIVREFGVLSKEDEQEVRDRGDGNVYGGDTYVGQTIFGVEDRLQPIEDYIDEIKNSKFYNFFIETVTNPSEKTRSLSTDPAYHAFSEKYKTLESVGSAIAEKASRQTGGMDEVFRLIDTEEASKSTPAPSDGVGISR